MLNIAECKTGEEGKEWRDNGTNKTGADGTGTNTDTGDDSTGTGIDYDYTVTDSTDTSTEVAGTGTEGTDTGTGNTKCCSTVSIDSGLKLLICEDHSIVIYKGSLQQKEWEKLVFWTN